MLGDLVYLASPYKSHKGIRLFPSPFSKSVLKMPGDTKTPNPVDSLFSTNATDMIAPMEKHSYKT